MLRSDLCNYVDAFIVVKGSTTVEGDNDAKARNKKLIMPHLDHAYQKSITHLEIM